MKRPAHMTLVDADRYSALVSRCTEQRERAEKAEARSEALEKERDDFILLALCYERLASAHDMNRFLGWVRGNHLNLAVPDLVTAFFQEQAERSRQGHARMDALVGKDRQGGWVPRAWKLEKERDAALCGEEEKHG